MQGETNSAESRQGTLRDVERYAYSDLTDTWYLVYDWEDLGDGQILSKSKEEVSREDVPAECLTGVKERGSE